MSLFIILDGPDGAGKTTQVLRLADALRSHGRQVLVTAEPSKGPIGLHLRRHLDPDTPPEVLACLFAGDRRKHLELEVEPALAGYFVPFLAEASRVLRPGGIVFAKIKDYVHNHRYQWMLVEWVLAVRSTPGLTACDLIIKRDPCGGNLKSGRWKRAHHARNAHCWWAVVRKGRCEP